MCNKYVAPAQMEIDFIWQLEPRTWWKDSPQGVFPRSPGPFIRRAIDDPGYSREGVTMKSGTGLASKPMTGGLNQRSQNSYMKRRRTTSPRTTAPPPTTSA